VPRRNDGSITQAGRRRPGDRLGGSIPLTCRA
jgi:hypothetical protein